MLSPRKLPQTVGTDRADLDVARRTTRLGSRARRRSHRSRRHFESGCVARSGPRTAPVSALRRRRKYLACRNRSRARNASAASTSLGSISPLQPEAPYELRPHPGYGCEDPRVTYVGELKAYVMAYTAFGPDGPRIALAHLAGRVSLGAPRLGEVSAAARTSSATTRTLHSSRSPCFRRPAVAVWPSTIGRCCISPASTGAPRFR